VGSLIEGEVKSITEFGLFIGLDSDIDGMVHLSDLSWSQPGEEAIKAYEKGQMVKAKVLDIDIEKERVSLGIKQLEEGSKAEKASAAASSSSSSSSSSGGGLRKNQVVTGTVTEVNETARCRNDYVTTLLQ
jgi:small subunit ribosomal protein S1